MGQMYPRKPFSGLATSVDPEAVLRDVRAPSIPPKHAEQAPGARVGMDKDDASEAFPRVRNEITAFANSLGGALKDSPFATLGTTLTIGVAIGAVFGSRIARMAVLLVGGALLHNFAPSPRLATIRDTARRSGA